MKRNCSNRALVDNGSSDGGWSFEIDQRVDAAKVRNVHEAGAHDFVEVLKGEMINSNTKISGGGIRG